MILNRYERMIAKRYLLPGKGEGFIFLVASISLAAVMLGVAALIIVMSVMNGFRAELFDKIVGLNGHAVVQGYGGNLPDWRDIVAEARKTPGVTEAVPLIEQGLMASYDGRSEAVLVRGRSTVPQFALDRVARRSNVDGAFRLASGGSATVANRWVILVDDVVTTGATLSACAAALTDGGALAVSAVTVAHER